MLQFYSRLKPYARIQHQALMYFIQNKYESLAVLQLDSMPVRLVNFEDNLVLRLACKEGLEKVVTALLDKVNLLPKSIGNLIGITASEGQTELLKYLLTLPNIAENAGWGINQALHAACKKGHTEIVSLLLNVKSVQDPLGNQDNHPELYAALRGKHYSTALTLLMFLNDTKKISLDKKEKIYNDFKCDKNIETDLIFEAYLNQLVLPPQKENSYHAEIIQATQKMAGLTIGSSTPSTSNNLVSEEPFLSWFQRLGITDYWPDLEEAIVQKRESYAIKIIGECLREDLIPEEKFHEIIELALYKQCCELLEFLCQIGWNKHVISAAIRRGNENITLILLNEESVIHVAHEDENAILILAAEKNLSKVVQSLLQQPKVGEAVQDQNHAALRVALSKRYLGTAKIILQYYKLYGDMACDAKITQECFDLFFFALKTFKGQKYLERDYQAWITFFDSNEQNFDEIARMLFLMLPEEQRHIYVKNYDDLKSLLKSDKRIVIIQPEIITKNVIIEAKPYPRTLLMNKDDPYAIYGQLLTAINGSITQDAHEYAAYLFANYKSIIMANIELVLQQTVQTGNAELLVYLLDDKNVKSENNQPVLDKIFLYAASINSTDCSLLLAARRQNSNFKRDNQALCSACLNANFGMVSTLINDSEVSRHITYNNRIFRHAVRGGSLAIVKLLLKRFPEIAAKAADNDNEMLCISARAGYHGLVKRLLKVDVVVQNITVRDNEALFLAARNGNKEVVTLLLEYSAVKAKTHRALCASLKNKHYKVAKILWETYIEKSIKITEKDFDIIFDVYLEGLGKLSYYDIEKTEDIMFFYKIFSTMARDMQCGIEKRDQLEAHLKDKYYVNALGIKEHVLACFPDLMKLILDFTDITYLSRYSSSSEPSYLPPGAVRSQSDTSKAPVQPFTPFLDLMSSISSRSSSVRPVNPGDLSPSFTPNP